MLNFAQCVELIRQIHSSQAEMTHPVTAVHSGDEHDSQQDEQSGDEEAHHQVGPADDTVLYIRCLVFGHND